MSEEKNGLMPQIISTEDSKTIQEVSKLGVKGLDVLQDIGIRLSSVLGTVPEDLIGVLGGDRLRHKRLRIQAKLLKDTWEYIKEQRKLKNMEDVSPNIAIPIIQAAQDESREELQRLWSRLLANAMDPERSNAVRRNIIETVKQFEPIDALVLERICKNGEKIGTEIHINKLMGYIKSEYNETLISCQHLMRLNCLHDKGHKYFFTILPLGEEIIRACSL